MVPTGQIVHQARGWIKTISNSPMPVVTVHINQNTCPQWAGLPISRDRLKIINPINKVIMTKRRGIKRNHKGMWFARRVQPKKLSKKGSPGAEIATDEAALEDASYHTAEHRYRNEEPDVRKPPAQGDCRDD